MEINKSCLPEKAFFYWVRLFKPKILYVTQLLLDICPSTKYQNVATLTLFPNIFTPSQHLTLCDSKLQHRINTTDIFHRNPLPDSFCILNVTASSFLSSVEGLIMDLYLLVLQTQIPSHSFLWSDKFKIEWDKCVVSHL